MEKKYCNVCGAELRETSRFCVECGAKVENTQSVEKVISQVEDITPQVEKNILQHETVRIQNNNETKIKQDKKSPIIIIVIIIVILAILGGAIYGAIWIFAEFFSINTPPKYIEDEIEKTSNIDEENKTNKNNTYDTDGIDGIVDLKYTMEDIVGTWYVNFRNYVSLEGENIGLYQSYSEAKIKKIDETNFSITFNVKTAEVNGEPIEVGEQIFYGKLENDNISIQMDSNDDFLYTGASYTINFTPKVENGKLSGTNETILNKIFEGHNMKYRVVTEFIQD